MNAIRELLVTEPVEEKLAGRGISSEEAQQLIDNATSSRPTQAVGDAVSASSTLDASWSGRPTAAEL